MGDENWVQVGFTDESMSAGVVVWNGAAEMLVHSPALYLDELLLRDRERDARAFLDVVEGFFRLQQEHDVANLPRVEATVLDLPEPEQYQCPFIVKTELQDTFRAKSSFTPKLKAPRMLYPAFWMYWNKLIQELPCEAAAVRDNILVQCEWYRANGLSYRNLGVAPTHAAAKGASDRLWDETQTAPSEDPEPLRVEGEYQEDAQEWFYGPKPVEERDPLAELVGNVYTEAAKGLLPPDRYDEFLRSVERSEELRRNRTIASSSLGREVRDPRRVRRHLDVRRVRPTRGRSPDRTRAEPLRAVSAEGGGRDSRGSGCTGA